ncbi:MAG: hypothetical protein WAJ97_04035 [Terriglobales bacterium]|jgi:hypothetical protein
MKKRIAGVVFAVLILVALAFAQVAMKKEAPPKPALGPSQVLLENWNDIGRKLIARARRRSLIPYCSCDRCSTSAT